MMVQRDGKKWHGTIEIKKKSRCLTHYSRLGVLFTQNCKAGSITPREMQYRILWELGIWGG